MITSGLIAGDKKVVAYSIENDNVDKREVKVECTIEDGQCTVTIHKGGEVEEYTFPYEGTEKLNAFIESKVGGGDDRKARRKKIKIKRFGPDSYWGEQTWLGVHVQPLTDQLREFFEVRNSAGVLVSEVVEDSPADKAGLKAGDVIVKVEREKMEETDDLVEVIRKSDTGDEVTIKIIRDGKRETITATLDSRETDRRPAVAWFHGDDEEDFDVFHMPKLSVPGSDDYKSLKEELNELREELKELKKKIGDKGRK